MSKARLIRCKTPGDIVVVNASSLKEREDIAYALAREHDFCGHSHLIVFGDVYFSRGKRAAK